MRLTFLSILILCTSFVSQAQKYKTLRLDAGNLSSVLTTDEKDSITELILTGTIDARDFKIMRDSMPLLTDIDLRETNIIAYNGNFGTSLKITLYPENAIPDEAFFNVVSNRGKESLKSVILPLSTTSIGNAAFCFCSSLDSILIPSEVITIGEMSFGACESIKSVILPNSVTSIGASAFWKCTGLTSFTIPLSLTSIEYNAFSNSGLTSVNIPASVRSIKSYAFSDCLNLNLVKIPSSVTFFGDRVFNNCINLKSVYSYNTTPVNLTLTIGVFSGMDKNATTIYVPSGSMYNYQSASQWMDFVNFEEMNFAKMFDDLNLIKNGKFDFVDSNGGPLNWSYTIDDDKTGEAPKVNDGVIVLKNNATGLNENGHYKFSQENIQAIKDSLYLLSFVAWSDNDRTVKLRFEKPENGDCIRKYTTDPEATDSLEWTFPVTNVPQRYSFHVTFSKTETISNPKLSFMLSGDSGAIYLDSISMLRINELKMIDTIPSVSLLRIYLIAPSSVKCAAHIYYEGEKSVTEKGFCISASPYPTISDTKIVNEKEIITTFYNTITGLTPNTSYYIRPYALNENGISYGNNFKFKTDDCSGLGILCHTPQNVYYPLSPLPDDTCTSRAICKFQENSTLRFRKGGEFGIEWGSNEFPSGTALISGPVISVPAGTYEVTFSCVTGEYFFDKYDVACDIQDSLALVAVYNATNGDLWARNVNWLQGKVQTWYGITLNKEGRVIEINLGANNLNGFIPPEIGNLTELKKLILGYTYVYTGYGSNSLNEQPLPQTLENLVKLEVFGLDYISINNDLPDIFGSMTSLRELYLQYAKLTNHSFPVSITSCKNLERLDISNNNFQDLPDLSGLTNLISLRADQCYFSFEDIEPNLWISNFHYKDQQIKLGSADYLNPILGETFEYSIETGGENNIYQWYKNGAELPGQNSNTLAIENINLNDNGEYTLRVTNNLVHDLTLFSYPLTLFLKESPLFKALEAIYNSTDGDHWFNKSNWLSEQPFENWYGINKPESSGLYFLELKNNNLKGSLPEEIGDLKSFYSVEISKNPGLISKIPTTIGNLTNLQVLALNENNLTGAVPVEIANCTNLWNINLKNNFLSDLPDLSEMKSLSSLDVSYNKLEFDDIEPNSWKNFSFIYNNQKPYGEKEIQYLNIGDTVIFDGTAGGKNNFYTWEKVNVSTLPNQNNGKLILTSVTAVDEGIYRCLVNNNSAPYLYLHSELKYLIDSLKIDEYESDNYFKNAQGISNLDSQLRSIYPWGDRDIASFEVKQPSQIKVYCENGVWGSRQLSIYSSDTTTVLAKENDYVTVTILNPGTYFIETKSLFDEVIIDYNLRVEIIPFIPDNYEPDNNFADAKQIFPFLPQNDHNLKPPADVDFVKFEIVDAPRNITIDVYDEMEYKDFYIWLYNEDSTLVYFSNYGSKNNGSRIQTTITENGFYYLRNEVSTWHNQDMYDDYTISLTTDGQPPVITCNVNDSLALVAIYNATNGFNWSRNDNWITGHVQDWFGVKLNKDGRVIELNLACNGLSGYIPSEIGNLTEIERLCLGNTMFATQWNSQNSLYQQPLPNNMSNLTKLKVLSLDQLGLNNELPDIFDGMVNLRELYIQSNQFTNLSLPEGLADCKNLEVLDISSNDFNSLPDLSQLTRLTDFNADTCYFSFEDIEPNLWIPQFSYHNQRIIFGNTEFLNPEQGETIVRAIEVGGVNNVYQWMKDGQVLPGQTTNTLKIDSVTTADAGFYTLRITNTIVTQLVFYSKPLILYQNQTLFYKALESLYNNTRGDNWYNNSNWLTNEPFTNWYGIMQDTNGITYLTLSNNNLTGSLPENLGNLSIFNFVQISGNPGLTGEIPASIGELKNLQYLDLSSNNLTGNLPNSIGQLKGLSSLNISFNNIDSIPGEILNCESLKTFNFNNNRISDLPSFGNLNSLNQVFAQNNKLGFEDIIPLIGKIQIFNYSPQDSIGEPEIIHKQPGENVVISVISDRHDNYYSWYKNDFPVYYGSSSTYSKNILDYSDSGKYYCKITNSLAPGLVLYSKIKTLVVEYPGCPQHFQKVWFGNGTDHMNIYVFSAQNDEIDLEPGDEIGVFDGEFCVGYGKILQTINQQKLLGITVSKEDVSVLGYTEGHDIYYRIWDCSAKIEYVANLIQYYDNMLNPIPTQTFKVGATLFVKLSVLKQTCRKITFKKGWNLYSIPGNITITKTENVFQSLVNNNSLLKIQDEQGNSMENWGFFGGWVDNIGDISASEGYKVKVNVNDSLEICTTPLEYPFGIELRAGWNIMGYPQTGEFEGQEVVQALIDNGTLLKVQDELGNSIEDWGFFGGWTNNIGSFAPGEGYKIKVSADETLWINSSYTKSGMILPDFIATKYFKPEYEGNGVDHMNINLVGLPVNLLRAGDELAVFDGETCVGAITIMPHHLQSQTASIAASATDNQGMKGFTEGGAIILKLWSSKNNQEYNLEPEIIKGTGTFVKHETTLASLEKYSTTGLAGLAGKGITEINCYPNPFSEKVTIEINLAEDSQVEVEVLNQLGQRVKTVTTKEFLPGGLYKFDWDGTNARNQVVSKGIYYLRIEIDDLIINKKIVSYK